MCQTFPAARIGFVLFPNLTQLDLTGPWEVLTRLPNAECYLLSHHLDLVKSGSGLSIQATQKYADCPQLDVIVIPGGPGHLVGMQDVELLDFLRRQAAGCRYLTAVCTGTLVLAAAGLLDGYRATTHWQSLPRLAAFGATASSERVVFDGNRVTGGGVTAGIDFALRLLVELGGADLAKQVQLQMEYEPRPPFGGSPATADPEVIDALNARWTQTAEHVAAVDAKMASRLRQQNHQEVELAEFSL